MSVPAGGPARGVLHCAESARRGAQAHPAEGLPQRERGAGARGAGAHPDEPGAPHRQRTQRPRGEVCC